MIKCHKIDILFKDEEKRKEAQRQAEEERRKKHQQEEYQREKVKKKDAYSRNFKLMHSSEHWLKMCATMKIFFPRIVSFLILLLIFSFQNFLRILLLF